MTPELDLDALTLSAGSHESLAEGACVMEAVSFIAGEPWSDHPECASPVIATFLRTWNDALDDDTRQTLKQHIPRLVGSRGTGEQEERRAWMALDWLIRVHSPAWLRLAGLSEHADRLAELPEITAESSPVLDVLTAASVAAWDAASDTAWVAARAAASDAASDAAWDTAWVAARSAAWVAARAAAWVAARAAALDAASDAALDAAWVAARSAARAVASDAVREALAPTVAELQTSAHELVDRMLAVTTETEGGPE